MEKYCGIYLITNKLNGMQYVGKSVNLQKRFYDHKCKLGQWIDNEIEKYGKENFEFTVIEYCAVELLEEREKYWINYYNTFNEGYNKTRGGCGILRYDYHKIVELWQQGYSCKEIKNIMNCSDDVITTALRCNNISKDDVIKRTQQRKIKPMVACDITTQQPLKIFYTYDEIAEIKNQAIDKNSIYNALKHPYQYKAYGYYWNYLSNITVTIPSLTNEEFLSYQKDCKPSLTEEAKLHLSNSRRIVERPSRDILKLEIRTQSFVSLGKKYGVSDKAISKWCIFYHLPPRKTDIKTYTDEEWEKL